MAVYVLRGRVASLLKQNLDQLLGAVLDCIVEGSSRKAVFLEAVHAPLAQSFVDPSLNVFPAAPGVHAEDVEEILALLILPPYDFIVGNLGQQSEHKLELLLIKGVVHRVH